MRVVQASTDRLVIDVGNISTMRYVYVPILRPGEMQSICFLDRESDNIWRGPIVRLRDKSGAVYLDKRNGNHPKIEPAFYQVIAESCRTHNNEQPA
jgi:hypothetical protein